MSAVDRANYVVDKSDAYDDSPQLRLHFLQAIRGIKNHTPDQSGTGRRSVLPTWSVRVFLHL